MRVHYLFERRARGGATVAYPLPIAPTMIDMRREEATALTWTLGPEPVREHGGIRERTIEIRGRTGVRVRLGTDRKGRTVNMAATDLFREFEAFLAEYQTISRDEERAAWGVGGGGRATELRFHALWEGHHVQVEPRQFSWSRNAASSRHSYEWTLSLVAFADVHYTPDSWFLKAEELIQAGVDTINAYVGVIERIKRFSGEVRTTLTGIRRAVSAIHRAATALLGVAQNVRGITGLPAALFLDATNTAQTSAFAVAELIDAATAGAFSEATRRKLYEINGSISEARVRGLTHLARTAARDTIAAFGRSTSIGVTTVSSALTASEASTESVAEYRLRAGESLADVAEALLGDRSRWREIARANGAPDPSTAASGRPFQAGDTIVVPIPAGQTSTATDRSALAGEALLGIDLKLGSDGDLVLPGTSPDDFALVRGRACLEQSLSVRLTTEQGSSRPFPRMGLRPLVGTGSTATVQGTAAADVSEQALADPRIAEVTALEVIDAGDTYTVDCTLRPIVGADLTVRTPIPR